jgi:geranylgeranyl reductase family protein
VGPRVDVEVLVVGAGPAGVAAALEARRLGLSVTVAEKATFPRDKTCGDGLTAGALRLLDHIGLDVRALPSYVAVAETVLVSPAGREVVVPLPTDGHYAGVVRRIELDAALVAHAGARGVEVREQAALTELRCDAHGADAVLADGTRVRAAWIIAADGHFSPVRRLLAASAPVGARDGTRDLGTWHAFRQYFDGVDDRRLWVLFERDFLPGYAWVFPLGGGRANVGFGVLRTRGAGAGADTPAGKVLAAQWRTLVDRAAVRRALGPDARPEGSPRAWPIPATYDPARLDAARTLFVGDAAGVVDPMTGEGIAQALETGMLAARSIAETPNDVPNDASAVAAHYRSAVEAAVGRDLRFASALQRVLRSPFGARAAIAVAGLTPWTRRNFARWMFEDYPRALVLTPDRWRRGMFTEPGAYRDAG